MLCNLVIVACVDVLSVQQLLALEACMRS